jgi:hypothetical protein
MRAVKKLAAVVAAVVGAAPLVLRAHDASTQMAGATNALLAALSADQKAVAVFPFANAERTNWHFVPRARRGLSIKAMTPEQRLLTHALLAKALSQGGYTKAVGIMSLEPVLAALENNPRMRDPENYFLTVFGTPGQEPWAWRFEGHHLALNFTFAAGATPVATPLFFGANPAEIRDGPRAGVRALAAEEDLARALVKSLDADHRKTAVIMERAPSEIFNIPGRRDTKPMGIAWSDLDASQREMLLGVIREYVGRTRSDVADDDMHRLEQAGLEKIHFAWAGSLERGEPHYYRVQGGNFVLEYDNTQNGANHVHSLWRDFDHDFGADLLEQHYREAHADPR